MPRYRRYRLSDYQNRAQYVPEAGESKAHTYHWLKTFQSLGQLASGTGTITADYPAAVAFVKQGVTTYVVYNYG